MQQITLFLQNGLEELHNPNRANKCDCSTYFQMDTDGFQKFIGAVSRKEGHKHVLERRRLELLPDLCQRGQTELHHMILTCSLVLVSITRAFGTKMTVFVFLMNVTDIAGMAIWQQQRINLLTHQQILVINHENNHQFSSLYLSIFAKDLGMETDPVIRDKHFALIQNVFLQGTSVTCWHRFVT